MADSVADGVPKFVVVIVGNQMVGKTAFLKRFVFGNFTVDSHPTIGFDLRGCDVQVGDRRVRLEVWDTAGQERFRTITRSYYTSAQGVIVMYDTTNYESFEHVPFWLEEIGRYCKTYNVCVIVVGNKSDLIERRQVSHEDAQIMSAEHHVTFLEVSAQSNYNVQETFDLLASAMLHVREQLGGEEPERGMDLAEVAQVQQPQERRKRRCC